MLVIEDVITTGGQVALSTAALRAVGATVESVLCVIDRSGGTPSGLIAERIDVISLFTGADLE